MAGGRVYAGKNAERDKRNGIAGMGAGIIRVELRVFSFPSCSLQTLQTDSDIAWRMEHSAAWFWLGSSTQSMHAFPNFRESVHCELYKVK
jgi:hypothetical protein